VIPQKSPQSRLLSDRGASTQAPTIAQSNLDRAALRVFIVQKSSGAQAVNVTYEFDWRSRQAYEALSFRLQPPREGMVVLSTGSQFWLGFTKRLASDHIGKRPAKRLQRLIQERMLVTATIWN
jgi:hypothetical protein